MNIRINIAPDSDEMGRRASKTISRLINKAIEEKGEARIVLSTGQSQFEMLEHLINEDVDWTKVTMFHLDEYVDIPETHPASFRKYLKERFVSKVPLKEANFVEGIEAIPELSKKLREKEVDVGVIGIGENGHIAFNDPPADFNTDEVYKVVTLDDRCRAQQVGEGWFKSVSEVPEKAITMCPKAIMAAKHIVSVVPHKVKRDAVKKTILESVSPRVPATLLKTHPDWRLFLDADSAQELLGF